jgi:hypothetical protein
MAVIAKYPVHELSRVVLLSMEVEVCYVISAFVCSDAPPHRNSGINQFEFPDHQADLATQNGLADHITFGVIYQTRQINCSSMEDISVIY